MTATITLAFLAFVVWATYKVVRRPRYQVEVLFPDMRRLHIFTMKACNPQEAEAEVRSWYDEDVVVVATGEDV